jgi:hypothetical protein
MSDDVWRRGRNDEEEDFGPPLFADEATGEVPTGGSGLSFGLGGHLVGCRTGPSRRRASCRGR